MLADDFARRGWLRFGHDPELLDWLATAVPAAHAAVADPANADWLRCQGTWFAGVSLLANDTDGSVALSGPLRGRAVDFLAAQGLPVDRWDRAQVSVVYPGYPRPREGEGEAAFRFRRDRDAAHVDGLLPVGTDRRRMLRERHAFVLGLPLTQTSPGASPLVVWEGSQEMMRAALGKELMQHPPDQWPNADLSSAYYAARQMVFEQCERVTIHAAPGEAYVIHRLALHGVAPWQPDATASPNGRMIAYFRPEMPGPVHDWINLP